MIIIHDSRVPEEYITAIKEKLPEADFASFSGPKNKVYESIESHPDIYFFQLDEKTIIHAPCAPRKILNYLDKSGITLVEGKSDPGVEYPETARYNAVRIQDMLFHNLAYTDPVILEESKKKDLELVNVTQGYTRCSLLPVGEGSAITTDVKIAEIVSKKAIDVLLLSSEDIILPGEKHGFIGGSGGRASEGRVILLGDIKCHPESVKIQDFLKAHSEGYIMAENRPFYDAGGLIVVG